MEADNMLHIITQEILSGGDPIARMQHAHSVHPSAKQSNLKCDRESHCANWSPCTIAKLFSSMRHHSWLP
jgi:hypothetical protein